MNKNDTWEEEFDAAFSDWSDHKSYSQIKKLFHKLLAEREAAAYTRGLQEGEGTNNGVQRYQLGYKDATQRAVEVAEEQIIWLHEGSNPEHAHAVEQLHMFITRLQAIPKGD